MSNFTYSSLPVPHTTSSFEVQPIFLASIIANIISDSVIELFRLFDHIFTAIVLIFLCISLAASFGYFASNESDASTPPDSESASFSDSTSTTNDRDASTLLRIEYAPSPDIEETEEPEEPESSNVPPPCVKKERERKHRKHRHERNNTSQDESEAQEAPAPRVLEQTAKASVPCHPQNSFRYIPSSTYPPEHFPNNRPTTILPRPRRPILPNVPVHPVNKSTSQNEQPSSSTLPPSEPLNPPTPTITADSLPAAPPETKVATSLVPPTLAAPLPAPQSHPEPSPSTFIPNVHPNPYRPLPFPLAANSLNQTLQNQGLNQNQNQNQSSNMNPAPRHSALRRYHPFNQHLQNPNPNTYPAAFHPIRPFAPLLDYDVRMLSLEEYLALGKPFRRKIPKAVPHHDIAMLSLEEYAVGDRINSLKIDVDVSPMESVEWDYPGVVALGNYLAAMSR